MILKQSNIPRNEVKRNKLMLKWTCLPQSSDFGGTNGSDLEVVWQERQTHGDSQGSGESPDFVSLCHHHQRKT